MRFYATIRPFFRATASAIYLWLFFDPNQSILSNFAGRYLLWRHSVTIINQYTWRQIMSDRKVFQDSVTPPQSKKGLPIMAWFHLLASWRTSQRPSCRALMRLPVALLAKENINDTAMLNPSV